MNDLDDKNETATDIQEDQEEQATVAEMQKKIAQFEDLLLRSKADFINYRRRMDREREDWIQQANEGILRELLPIMDNFERGLQASKTSGPDQLLQGFQLIASQLHQLFQGKNVEKFGQPGDVFNPHEADALAMAYHDTIPANHIIEVIRPGYRRKSNLLRPAMVIVSRGQEAPKSFEEPMNSGQANDFEVAASEPEDGKAIDENSNKIRQKENASEKEID